MIDGGRKKGPREREMERGRERGRKREKGSERGRKREITSHLTPAQLNYPNVRHMAEVL